MSKARALDAERKGEGVSDSNHSLHMITSQVGAPTPSINRPSVPPQSTGHSFIVSSQLPGAGQYHEMKSFVSIRVHSGLEQSLELKKYQFRTGNLRSINYSSNNINLIIIIKKKELFSLG